MAVNKKKKFRRVRVDYLGFALMATRLFSFSIFLIHLAAWPWGSIISAHLLALVTITPLSTEK